MPDTTDKKDYQPVLLMPNISYPAYQLYAFAGAEGSDPETVLKICILETAAWLRSRFRKMYVPDVLQLPTPGDFGQFSLSQLTSSFTDIGYQLEIIWIPEEKIWTLRLEEPDMGPNPGSDSQARDPVPGRLIETNVSYCLINNRVECGFKTIISEPEGAAAECEVYRYTCIKNIARNKNAGMWQGPWQLLDRAHILKTRSNIKSLAEWLDDETRMVPAVVISEYKKDKEEPEEKPPIDFDHLLPPSKTYIDSVFNIDSPNKLEEIQVIEPKKSLIDAQVIPGSGALPRHRMGFAQYFKLPAEMQDHFIERTGIKIGSGEIIIIEPSLFEKKVHRYDCNGFESYTRKALDEIDAFIEKYPMKRELNFGDCIFVNEARFIELASTRLLDQAKDKLYKEAFAELDNLRHEIIKDQERKEKSENDKLKEKDKEIVKANEKASKLQQKYENVSLELQKQNEKFTKELEQKNEYIAWLEYKGKRPDTFAKVLGWVDERFKDKLIIFPKTHNKLKNAEPSKFNLSQVCDALEYLATEYRSELIGSISEEERNEISSLKYGRVFDVAPITGLIAKASPEYKIKYYKDRPDKPKESLLDLHLRIGNDNEKLIRIYFLYDKEKKLIVVGSLPEHLPTGADRT